MNRETFDNLVKNLPKDSRNRRILELMFYDNLSKEEVAQIYQISPRRIEQIVKGITNGLTTKEILSNNKRKEKLKALCDNLKEGIGEL